MASEVEICKMALGHVRASDINSLADTTVSAQRCKQFYPVCRDMVLEIGNWNFNTRSVALALLGDGTDGWAYHYQYPSEALRIKKLIPNITTAVTTSVGYADHTAAEIRRVLGEGVSYEVIDVDGTKVIRCDMADVKAIYAYKVTDPVKFSPSMTLAVSYLLASMLAIPLTGVKEGSSLRRECLALYDVLMKESTASNNNQNSAPPRESDFSLAHIAG